MGKAKKKGKKGKKKKKKKKKKQKPEVAVPVEPNRGFLLDIIVLRVESVHLNHRDIDRIDVDVDFNRNFIKITSSRINIVDFIPGRSYVFEANSKTIGKILANNPLVFTVNFNNKPIGTSVMQWPDVAISTLEKLQDVTFTFKGHLSFEDQEDNASTFEVLVRLQPKCMELPEELPTCLPDKCEAAQKTISPNDVIFLVGDEFKVDACNDIPFYQQKKNETLDFAAYQIYHGGTLAKVPELPNMFCSLKCCRIKEIAKEYGPGVFDYILCDKELQKSAKGKTKFVRCEITSDVSSSTSLNSCSINCASDEEADGCKQCVCDQNNCDSLENKNWNTPQKCLKVRCCKKCKVRLRYSDRLAPCAICGSKPIVRIQEKKAQNYTADEILAEYIKKNPAKNVTCLDCQTGIKEDHGICADQVEEPPEFCPCLDRICECRCHDGKVCAYCRVRNTCDVVDLRTLDPDEYIKSIQGIDMETTCAPPDVEPEIIPPFLATVFEELKSIYKIDDEADQICKKRLEKYDRVQKLKKLFRPKPGTYQSFNMTPTACKEIKTLCRDMRTKLERPTGRIKKRKPVLSLDINDSQDC